MMAQRGHRADTVAVIDRNYSAPPSTPSLGGVVSGALLAGVLLRGGVVGGSVLGSLLGGVLASVVRGGVVVAASARHLA